MNRRQRKLIRQYTYNEPGLFILVLRSLFRLEITAGWFWIGLEVWLILRVCGVL